jgi:hypothetical protein
MKEEDCGMCVLWYQGGIARNQHQHGAAEQSGVGDGRQDASAKGAQPLTARTP